VLGHEASNSSNRRVLTKTNDLSISLNTVVLEGLKRNGLVHTLNLLGLGVNLLLTLLSTSTKTKYQVKSRLLLDVVIREGTAIFKLLSGKDQTLLIRRNSFLVLDLGLYVVNRIRRLNIECDGLACALCKGSVLAMHTMCPRRKIFI
jgi:hypothetical protein